MLCERDVMVKMRDGVHLCVDVYRPETAAKVPALLSFANHNKEGLSPEVTAALPPQPAWSTLWFGNIEGGDSRFLVSRGYAHVTGQARGSGKSEGGGSPAWDHYDLIEWMAAQPWCDGNIGMIGISSYGAAQLQAAMQAPPHLKAIFPYDPGPAYREFRDRFPGGVVHSFQLVMDSGSVNHGVSGRPGELPAEKEAHWRAAMDNPDNRMYAHLYSILSMKGQKSALMYNTLTNPYDTPQAVAQAEANFDKIRIPTYTGTGWYSLSYKSHFQGAQNWYRNIKAPKKMMFTGPAALERPFRAFHDEVIRWYDHWLRGIDTGIMDEPPVKIWVMGANRWRYAQDWPLPETQWTKYYLHSWERLRPEPIAPESSEGYEVPDAFVQMPPTHTRSVQKLRYLTEPLATDTLVIGPISLTLYAAIDQDDTNWIVILKDVGPDNSVRTARPGEEGVPAGLPERELTRGWLKASHRAMDEARSTPWKPWHVLTREAQQPVPPGEIVEYRIEILSTANLFARGHRICLEITSLDLPTGVGGATNVEYIPYHICSSRITVHRIYRDASHPSHLLLPIVPVQ